MRNMEISIPAHSLRCPEQVPHTEQDFIMAYSSPAFYVNHHQKLENNVSASLSSKHESKIVLGRMKCCSLRICGGFWSFQNLILGNFKKKKSVHSLFHPNYL